MSNEIKVGDKVRVREDAPRILRKVIPSKVFDEYSEVIAQDDEMAVIWTEPIHKNLIPLKYLIKVEEEKKEPKFKRGDKVVLCGFRGFTVKEGAIGEVWGINPVRKHCYDVAFDGGGLTLEEKYLTPYTEPTEQTEAEKKPNVGSIKIPVEVDLTDSYWDAYTADLAKEIALKVANKYNDPEQTAEYAVKAAKAVVEGLKRK